MADIRIVMNVAGYNAYRNSPDVVALLTDVAEGLGDRFRERVAAYAAAHDIDPPPSGEHVKVTITRGGTRARAYVRTSSIAARLAEARDRALLQSLGGGA